jgi:dTDP-L-rhamnose 4-epimerase
MSTERVLITGGAGFIGSHLVDRLVDAGRSVRVLDSLEPQVHGDGTGHRNAGAEYQEGSVLDSAALEDALEGITEVVHLAAQVGVGQSMYEPYRYVHENCSGTALLLDRIANQGQIRSLVVASSMSIYGEGAFECSSCGDDVRAIRTSEALGERRWEPTCERCGGELQARPTSERKRLEPDSVYATSKRDQEELCLTFGRAHGIRSIALRLFNVYGPRQSLSNPYTGVAAIFASRLLAGNAPLVYEDGLQSRDFVHVSDIARAFHLALDAEDVTDFALNVGTGNAASVLDVARELSTALEVEVEVEIVGRFRAGDIRHCWPDISLIKETLGYEPKVTFSNGMQELGTWIRENQPPSEDRVEDAAAELERRGLVV